MPTSPELKHRPLKARLGVHHCFGLFAPSRAAIVMLKCSACDDETHDQAGTTLPKTVCMTKSLNKVTTSCNV